MDGDTESTSTSFDDKTEDFCDNPTRDALAEGLLQLFKPSVDQLSGQVRTIRISQFELKQNIESLVDQIKVINDQNVDHEQELEVYIKRINNIKNKVTVVSNVLQSCEDRLRKLHQNIQGESPKNKLLEGTTSTERESN